VSLAPPSKYDSDAGRIDSPQYIPASATTESEIKAALANAGFPSSAIPEIASWLATESDAWEANVVAQDAQTAPRIASKIDRETGGVISPGRAREMGESMQAKVDAARSEAAGRVTSSGQIREQGGGFGPKLQNAEEVVREDGIYYRATEGASNPGREYLGARFDK
jgi:hypothetical protein